MNAKRANQILMLDTDASFDDIRYAYRKLVLDLHPDKNKNEAKGEKFKIVSEAYHYLKKQHKQKNSKYQNTRKQQKNNYNEHNSEGDWIRSGMKLNKISIVNLKRLISKNSIIHMHTIFS